MRIDVRARTSDPPFLIDKFNHGVRFAATCNGRVVDRAISADEERGEVQYLAKGLVLPPCFLDIRVCYGKVQILEVPDASAQEPD